MAEGCSRRPVTTVCCVGLYCTEAPWSPVCIFLSQPALARWEAHCLRGVSGLDLVQKFNIARSQHPLCSVQRAKGCITSKTSSDLATIPDPGLPWRRSGRPLRRASIPVWELGTISPVRFDGGNVTAQNRLGACWPRVLQMIRLPRSCHDWKCLRTTV